MNDIMLDLETMGTGPTAAIMAIGAVEFDLQAKTPGREFYEVVDLDSAMKAGGTVDASTILWWMQQSDAAREAFKRPGIEIRSALGLFAMWVFNCGGSSASVWGNGAAFDNVILRSAYDRLGLTAPWSFRNDRCFRTVKAMHPAIDWPYQGTAHNALADAKSQAVYLMEVVKCSKKSQ